MMDADVMSGKRLLKQLRDCQKQVHSLELAMKDAEAVGVRKQNPLLVKQYNAALKAWGDAVKKLKMMVGGDKQFEGEEEGSKLGVESDNYDASRISADLKEDDEGKPGMVDDGKHDELDGYSSDVEAKVERMKMFVSEKDPDYLAPGEAKVNYRKWVCYTDQIFKSEGFVIDDFPGPSPFAPIRPLDIDGNTTTYSFVAGLATEALGVYNSDNGRSYKFHKLVRTNVEFGIGGLYYVTFEAKNPEDADATQTFEAKVLVGFKEKVVKFCRTERGSDGVA